MRPARPDPEPVSPRDETRASPAGEPAAAGADPAAASAVVDAPGLPAVDTETPTGSPQAADPSPYGVWRHLCADGCNCRPI